MVSATAAKCAGALAAAALINNCGSGNTVRATSPREAALFDAVRGVSAGGYFVCVAVDPREGGGSLLEVSPQPSDPGPSFLASARRLMPGVYPASECSRGAQGLLHRPSRRQGGIEVTLGPVAFDPDHSAATLTMYTSTGELTGEVARMRLMQRRASDWYVQVHQPLLVE